LLDNKLRNKGINKNEICMKGRKEVRKEGKEEIKGSTSELKERYLKASVDREADELVGKYKDGWTN
jgi:hypothetical protein